MVRQLFGDQIVMKIKTCHCKVYNFRAYLNASNSFQTSYQYNGSIMRTTFRECTFVGS